MRVLRIACAVAVCCGVLCAQDEFDDEALPEETPVARTAGYAQLLERFVSESSEELIIHTMRCQHVSAETLRRLVENFLSPGGTVACSDEDDVLVVHDTAARMEQIKQIIEEADKPVPQVLVEARIVEFEISDEFTKEVELGFAKTGDSDALRRTFMNLVGLPGLQGDSVQEMDASAGGGSNGRIWAFGGNDSFKMWALVRYLQTKNYARLLSSPNIVIRRGADGNIVTGERVPIPTDTLMGNGNVQTTVKYENVGVKLIVRPLMVSGERIRLRINPEFSSITRYDTDNKAPVFAQRSASTELEANSGDMIVLGGLLRKEERITDTRVPYLSNIPLLGWFFKGKTTRAVTSQLVIFMTPYLITPENAAARDATQTGVIPENLRNKIIEIEERVNDADAQPWKPLPQDGKK